MSGPVDATTDRPLCRSVRPKNDRRSIGCSQRRTEGQRERERESEARYWRERKKFGFDVKKLLLLLLTKGQIGGYQEGLIHLWLGPSPLNNLTFAGIRNVQTDDDDDDDDGDDGNGDDDDDDDGDDDDDDDDDGDDGNGDDDDVLL
ncbi:unnamed protein product [Brugia pahangi]|uniref:Uncharacterized protein n=1 Tax=Brugia pahangi TaxID=6280 RepID=A0A0N4TP71_BRUPA|nr:unnamed protein product [Brugia pahangi]